MTSYFSLDSNTIHLWRAYLPELTMLEVELLPLLNSQEAERAARFRMPIHRQRFILARGLLRRLLSLYCQVPAANIHFEYGAHGKPFLISKQVQFNLSHSHDMVVFAVTDKNTEVGVDIEKVEGDFREEIAKRFFSQDEYFTLLSLPPTERTEGFYRIWAAKEAVIKALGQGLFIPLEKFTVLPDHAEQWVELMHEETQYTLYLKRFFVHSEYQAVFASTQPIEKIQYGDWTPSGPLLT